jgi:hypothetical protein
MPVGPTPIQATHQLDILYTVESLGHVLQLRCYATGSGSSATITKTAGGTLTPAAAAAAVANLIKPLFKTTSSLDSWRLQKYDGGRYLPVSSGSLGVAGTSTSPTVLTSQASLTFRDDLNNRVNVVFLEVAGLTVPFHGGYATVGATWQGIVDDLLNIPTGTVGSWWTGRAGVTLASFNALTASLNRKARRNRNLV